jgi:hypothetical protein
MLSSGDSVLTRVYKNFQSLQRECVILDDDQYTFNRSGISKIHLKIFNPYPFIIHFRHEELPVVFQIAFIKNGNIEVIKNLELPANISKLNIGETISFDGLFTIAELPQGIYKVAICSETGILYNTYNSKLKLARISD